MLLVFVDDIILASKNNHKLNEIKELLKQEFQMEDLGDLSYFLGIKIERDMERKIIYLNQQNYLKTILNRFNMESCKPVDIPLDTKFKIVKQKEENFNKPYRNLIGCLMYAMLGTRPDLCVSISFLSRAQNEPNEQMWNCLKRVLRYIQGTLHMQLVFKCNHTVVLEGYSDANWGGDEDCTSTTGYLFKVFGSTVSWATQKQITPALSSAEAEYMALSAAVCEALWLEKLLIDLCFENVTSITMFEDNQSCIQIARNPEHHRRTKHIEINIILSDTM